MHYWLVDLGVPRLYAIAILEGSQSSISRTLILLPVVIAVLKVNPVAIGIILTYLPVAIAVLEVSSFTIVIFNLDREAECNP